MIPSLRQDFNGRFRPETYQQFLKLIHERVGAEVKFRLCETPCFFPQELLDKMATAGQELLTQLVGNPEYERVSDLSIPPEYKCPREDSHPLFAQVDFGLIRDAAGELQPRLVEIQGFPSLYAFQPELARCYIDAYGLDPGLRYLMDGLTPEAYRREVCAAILGGHDPENVILLEIDPRHQKTLPDFLCTEAMCGVRAVCITEVVKKERKLFYRDGNRLVPIHRIYNRVIVDELERRAIAAPFSFTEDLDVEWAGHPNWFFRISKFSLPYLKHPTVPQTSFLSDVKQLPGNLSDYVLKPLYSFAGLGVIVGPDREEVEAVPADLRSSYVLQERMRFEPVIETPHGMTQAEIRIMFLWRDRPRPVTTIIRMGRGKMMGVDHNRDLEWVGASAALSP